MTNRVKCTVCGTEFDSDLEICPVCGQGPDAFVPAETDNNMLDTGTPNHPAAKGESVWSSHI